MRKIESGPKNQKLNGLYLDEDSPYFLSGNLQKLTKAGNDIYDLPPSRVADYLRGEPACTMHQPRLRAFRKKQDGGGTAHRRHLTGRSGGDARQ